MRKGLKFLALAALLIGAAIATFFFTRRQGATTPPAAAAAAPAKPSGPAAPIEADGYLVQPTRVKVTVPATGTLVANESVNIVGEVSRRLVKVHVSEGAIVKKNDLLFKLDDADLLAQLARLRVRRTYLQAVEARQQKLLQNGLLSQQDYDESVAEVNLIQAEITELGVTLARTNIRAPFAGTVGLRRLSEGAWVTPDRPITTLQDTSRIKVDFNLPERYAPSLKVGQTISFQVAGRDARYAAAVVAIEPQIQASTRSLLVRAVTDNPKGELTPGSFASIDVPLQEIEGGVMIPSQAVVPSLTGHGVFVAQNGVAQLKEIELGVRTDTEVQVVSGLAMGDTILLTNLLRVRPGVPVKVTTVCDKLCANTDQPAKKALPEGETPPKQPEPSSTR